MRERVVYAGWLGCLPWKQTDDNADAALPRVSLSRQANDPAKSLSGGQLRRLGIAQSLARNGTWLLLDEPFAGLDPTERIHLQHVLKGISRTVHMVISTHQTADIITLFDTIVVIDAGRMLWRGGPAQFFAMAPDEFSGTDRAMRTIDTGKQQDGYRTHLAGADDRYTHFTQWPPGPG